MDDEPPAPKGPDRQLDRVLAKADAGGGNRGALYVWMYKRHDALVARFEKRRRDGLGGPNWPALVAEFVALGLTDATGKPPTLRGAQQTWYRVVRDVKRARGAAKGRARVPAVVPAALPGEMAHGVRPAVPVPIPPLPAPPATSSPVSDVACDSPPNPSAELARMRAILKQRST